MEQQELKSKKNVSSVFDHFKRPISLLIALIILIAGYFLVWASPIRIYMESYSLLAKLNSDIALAQIDLKKTEDNSAKLFQPSQLETKLLNMALPLKPDDSALITQITSMASKAGFAVSNIDIEQAKSVAGSKTNSDKISKVAIRLQLKGGGYDQLKELLKLTESSLMIMDVNSINFSAKSPTYDLILTAYYFNNPVSVK